MPFICLTIHIRYELIYDFIVICYASILNARNIKGCDFELNYAFNIDNVLESLFRPNIL